MIATLTPDPVLIFQAVVAGFIFLTLPKTIEGNTCLKSNAEVANEPFALDDGNDYIEHAGMTIKNELYQALHLN